MTGKTALQASHSAAKSKGENTRQQIVGFAADLASSEGLEGITVGGLAKSIGMSKSGLFAHFGSKEELQLAVVDWARARFEADVLPPAENSQEGIQKLYALMIAWADSIDKSAYRGGCFFAAASAEFDDRPGAVRDELARLSQLWIELLEKEGRRAKKLGQLDSNLDIKQMVFELHAFVQEANWAKQLMDNSRAFTRARTSIVNCLRREATAKGRRILSTRQF